MRAEYKRDMNHNYLILQGDIELDTSSYQVRMLAGNVIPSLLNCRFHGVDGKTVFHYEITSKQSIAVLYEQKQLNVEDLQLIFGSFVKVMEQMSEYLLNPAQILLQPEYMYMDVEKQEIFFCYLPCREQEIKEQFLMLTEYLLPKINHADENAVTLGYGVYRRAMEENFHLEYVKEELFRMTSRSKKSVSENKQDNLRDYRQELKENLDDFQGSIWEKDAGTEEKQDWNAVEEMENFFQHYSDKPDQKESGKKRSPKKKNHMEQKIYMIIPVVGTVVLMGILGANMLGILPWFRVEIFLLAVVLLCIISAVVCFGLGRVQKCRRQAVSDRKWKEKVKKSEELVIEAEPVQEPVGEENVLANIHSKNLYPFENFSDTKEHTGNYGETVVLSAGHVRGPASLVSREPGELATIYLKEELTVIGKLETAADAVIPLPTISRLHAKIRKRDGDYYLADLNSKNGTSVNGKMLKVDEEYLLQDEDEVDFAQARYIFLK